MFFKKINEWSRKRLKITYILSNFFYCILALIIPIIIVCKRYRIFKETSSAYKLTGFGIIFFIILGIYGYIKVRKMINKLPQITLQQQRVKFTLSMFFNLIPSLLLILAFWFTKDNVNLAYKTMLDCVIAIACATLFDGLICKYLAAELEIRNKALELNEIDKRRGKVNA